MWGESGAGGVPETMSRVNGKWSPERRWCGGEHMAKVSQGVGG